MDRPPIPPPPPAFPHGVPPGPAPEIFMLNNGFARMNVNPNPNVHPNHNPANPANAVKPIHIAPKLDSTPPLNGRPPVTFEGFTFRKAEPEMFGQKQTWAKSNRVPLPVGQGALLDQVKKQQQRKKVLDQLSDLDRLKRGQIDRLIEEKRREEKDPRFEWNVAAVKLETKDIGRRGIETTCMQVILSRKLRATIMTTPPQAGGKGEAGKVVDLDAPKTTNHKEHSQAKAYAEQGPVFMHPGMGAPAGPKAAMGGQFGPSPFFPQHQGQHQGQHPGAKAPNGPQMRQGHPEVVVVPEHPGLAQPKGPQMYQGHPEVIVMPDRPPSRPAPQMGHAFAQPLPHMMPPQQQQPHHHHQQAPKPANGAQMRPGHPDVFVVPEHIGRPPSRGPQMQQPHQQQPHHHHQASKPYKPDKKSSSPKVVNQKSHKGVEEWLDRSEDDESYDSEFSSDADDLSVFTPESSLGSDSRRKRDSPRRGSLHKHHRRHSEDEDRRRPVLREHHRKTHSDPPRSRGSRYHRDTHDLYPEDSNSHRPLPLRRQSIASVPELPRPRLARPLTYRPDDYDHHAGFTESLRLGLPRSLTYQYGRHDERQDMLGSRFPFDEPMPPIRETGGLDYLPVRRVAAMPFAPEPFADSGRERMKDRRYQQEMEREYEQEMKRKEYIGMMRRASGAGYPRSDRYGYPSL